MSEKYLPAIGVIGLAVLITAYFLVVVPQETAKRDSLAFSNTATWEPALLTLAKGTTVYPFALFEAISLPPPATNSSHETTAELATLKSYQALRTPQELSNIVAEEKYPTMAFGGHTVGEYMDAHLFPATSELLTDSVHDVTVMEMKMKLKFNRVRPNALDPSLSTAIEVPRHPSYPSGHSTETHFIAYVLGELAPLRRDGFIARADQIAKNREIAGLHYPSDTAAGVLLAQQLFVALMKNEKFEKLLAAAKKEWVVRGLTTATSSPASAS